MSDDRLPGCPAEADLIRACDDGAMPQTEARAILAHAEICEQCRSRLQLADAIIRADATFLEQEYDGDGYRRFASFTRNLDAYTHPPLLVRLTRLPRLLAPRVVFHLPAFVYRPTFRWMSMAAVGPALLAGIMLFNSMIAVVRAEALLKNVVIAAQALPAGLTQQVEIKVTPDLDVPSTWTRRRGPSRGETPRMAVRPFSMTREIVDGSGAAFASEWPPDVKRLVDLQPLDPTRPLDTARYEQWRRALTDKHDEVIQLDGGLQQLRTTTMQGPLREMSLIVESATYRVVKQVLVFDIGRVEITERGHETRNLQMANGAGGAGAAGAAAATANANDDARETVDRDLLDRSELDARLMLRESGLDLDGEFTVSRQHNAIVIDGIVITDAQRRDLSAKLKTLPLVEPALRVRESGVRAVVAPRPALSRWLTHTFAEGSTARTRFVPELTHLMSVVSQRLAAMQDLAERYPPNEVRALAPASRERLQRLLNLHYSALNADLYELDLRRAVIFGSRDRCVETAQAPADWSRRAVTGLRHARMLDQQIQELLSHDDLPPADAAGAHPNNDRHDQIDRTFSALWDAINLTPATRNLMARGPAGT